MPDGDPVRIQIDPPPPPRAMMMGGVGFGLAAGFAGLAGYCKLAGILAFISVGFQLADFFTSRGTVSVPRAALEKIGWFRTGARPNEPGTPSPRA
jgi:hypothetical protein